MFVVSSETWPSQARIVLISTPERSRCAAVVCLLSLQRHRRHTHGSHSLQGREGQTPVPIQVVQNNLGHASVVTTSIFDD